ncbi:MAG: nucleotide exchange factor GrpE [Muribaculaceae bacterium]|nr:nucleotide exchange factor GrpE [Muribaculaceae bacterium]
MKKDKHEEAAEELRDSLHLEDAGVDGIDTVLEPDDNTEELEESLNTEMTEVEKLREHLEQTQAALEKEKKEYMFLMADFDNFRKRVVKEKAELIKNGAEKVLLGLLPIVDDFERGLEATKDADDASAVREGMELIYNKLVKYLDNNGVKAMDSTGKDFDADLHEAIATIPAPSEELKGKVVDTTQKGYTLNDKVLRHAKVAVGE